MSTKHIKIIFIAVFFLLSLVPIILLDVTPDKVSQMENRMLKNMPTLNDHSEYNLCGRLIHFAWDFETYIKDRIGFREQAVNFYKIIKPQTRPDQYVDGNITFIIGQEGHQYFASYGGEMIGKMQGNPLLSDTLLTSLSRGLDNIARHLEQKGIPMFVIICPDKDSVYPEYLPKSINKASSPIPLDNLINYLQNTVNADVYSVKDRLISEKDNYMTYNKAVGDLTHYNSIGAFIEYQELTERLVKYFPKIKPLTFDDVTISYDDDAVPRVEMNDTPKFHEVPPDFFDNINTELLSKENSAYENDDTSLPTILFMRDSYFDLFNEFFASNFGKTIGMHYRNMTYFDEYIDTFNPDVVVIETAERQLDWFARMIIEYDNARP